jgi:hypothetical protein
MKTSADHATAHLSQLPRLPAAGPEDAEWTPIRHVLGIGAFGVNAWHGARAGAVVIEAHDEVPGSDCGCAGHEELYVVIEGRARFDVGEEAVDAPAGTLIAVPPHVHRKAVALVDDTTILAIGAPRGEPFVPAPWERRTLDRAGLL